jgi:hypothetical protein
MGYGLGRQRLGSAICDLYSAFYHIQSKTGYLEIVYRASWSSAAITTNEGSGFAVDCTATINVLDKKLRALENAALY